MLNLANHLLELCVGSPSNLLHLRILLLRSLLVRLAISFALSLRLILSILVRIALLLVVAVLSVKHIWLVLLVLAHPSRRHVTLMGVLVLAGRRPLHVIDWLGWGHGILPLRSLVLRIVLVRGMMSVLHLLIVQLLRGIIDLHFVAWVVISEGTLFRLAIFTLAVITTFHFRRLAILTICVTARSVIMILVHLGKGSCWRRASILLFSRISTARALILSLSIEWLLKCVCVALVWILIIICLSWRFTF